MNTKITLNEAIFSAPSNMDDLIEFWDDNLTTNLLELVWKAYDELQKNEFAKVNWAQPMDDLERGITELLERKINSIMNSYLPCIVQHGPFERELRSPSPAQPPEYDIAFIARDNQRIMWPLEAKVLANDRNSITTLGDYITTINDRYLTCRYAPFSNGGAMLAYLLAGNPSVVFDNVATQLGKDLIPHPNFPGRMHRHSDHNRSVPTGKAYVSQFRCQHLIFKLSNTWITFS